MFADGDQIVGVVVNGEDQYSIWPLDQPLPDGRAEAGHQGAKGDCLAYIETVWSDVRSLTARRAHRS